LKFKQDKVQFTAESYILFCVTVCVLLAAAGDVGCLVLQQGHIPEEFHTNLVQNSHFKRNFVGVGD
jgi:hypothetical protein